MTQWRAYNPAGKKPKGQLVGRFGGVNNQGQGTAIDPQYVDDALDADDRMRGAVKKRDGYAKQITKNIPLQNFGKAFEGVFYQGDGDVYYLTDSISDYKVTPGWGDPMGFDWSGIGFSGYDMATDLSGHIGTPGPFIPPRRGVPPGFVLPGADQWRFRHIVRAINERRTTFGLAVDPNLDETKPDANVTAADMTNAANSIVSLATTYFYKDGASLDNGAEGRLLNQSGMDFDNEADLVAWVGVADLTTLANMESVLTQLIYSSADIAILDAYGRTGLTQFFSNWHPSAAQAWANMTENENYTGAFGRAPAGYVRQSGAIYMSRVYVQKDGAMSVITGMSSTDTYNRRIKFYVRPTRHAGAGTYLDITNDGLTYHVWSAAHTTAWFNSVNFTDTTSLYDSTILTWTQPVADGNTYGWTLTLNAGFTIGAWAEIEYEFPEDARLGSIAW